MYSYQTLCLSYFLYTKMLYVDTFSAIESSNVATIKDHYFYYRIILRSQEVHFKIMVFSVVIYRFPQFLILHLLLHKLKLFLMKTILRIGILKYVSSIYLSMYLFIYHQIGSVLFVVFSRWRCT